MNDPDEESLLRSVAVQNARTILLARQRAEDELVQAKEALEKRTAQLARSLSMVRATLESATDGILVVDESGRVSDFNARFLDMWKISRHRLEGSNHTSIVEWISSRCEDPAATRMAIEAIESGSTPYSFDILELSDRRVLERYSMTQLVDQEPVGRVWRYRDITERRIGEAAAQKAAAERDRLLESEQAARATAERMSDLKDEFLANLSHELRTPLNAVLGWIQVLRQGDSNEEEMRRGLETIERNARVQAQLIEDLLDMSRITSGKVRLDVQTLEPVTVVESAIETMRPAAEAKGIRLERMLDSTAGPIAGDSNRLQQVVWNLLSNAIKFTPRGGKVQILLERVNSSIEITVADTGIGIPPEFLDHVFERFRQADASITRKHGGLGLGLSIVKYLVELHGGTVRADSEGDGQGTTFTVQLPLTIVHRGRRVEERFHPTVSRIDLSEYKRLNLSGVKVVVVDDEADGRELIDRVLSDCSARVFTAGGADEALLLVERERPDVLISDIGMAAVDGYELLRRVRALGADRGGKVPAVALTAFARSEDRTRALRAGFSVHVAKPVDPSELIAIVASISDRIDPES